MHNHLHKRLLCLLILTCSPNAHAGIISGFNGLEGWTLKQRDTSPPPILDGERLQLTSGVNNKRNLWFETQQDISTFKASFAYENFGGTGSGYGLSFIVQNAPDGTSASAAGSYGFSGISPAVGVVIFPSGSVGFYRNGNVGSGDVLTDPLSFSGGNEIFVDISYNGSFLTVDMTDGEVSAPRRSFFIDPALAESLGAENATIGFGASTGGFSGASQFISDFKFIAIPEPGSLTGMVLGLVGLWGYRRRRR